MGVVFVVLFVAGFMVFSTPSSNKDTAKWQRWWTDGGHRVTAVIGAYLIVLGVLAFVWFLWSLRDRLADGGGPMLTFGTLFVAMVLVSTLLRAAIPGAKMFGNVPVPSGDLARQFDNLGFGLLLVAGALSAGAFTAFASYAARREAVLPSWLTAAGYVVAVLQLIAGIFFPFVLFVLWVLVVSIVLLRRGATAEAAAPVTVAPAH
ncbi:MAG TPA: hypothetical protein VFC33_16345 [Acidimicrobiia bacterium]|nr:hypothetical protein [Acidimicrobiia bacterium]